MSIGDKGHSVLRCSPRSIVGKAKSMCQTPTGIEYCRSMFSPWEIPNAPRNGDVAFVLYRRAWAQCLTGDNRSLYVQ
jgi:hypothetical protein